MKSRGITIAGIVERKLRRHYVAGIESRRQSFQMDKTADKQAGRRDEHDSQSHFAPDQQLTETAGSSCDAVAAAGHKRPKIDTANLQGRQCANEKAGQQ